MNEIKFSENRNNKLDCRAFSTVWLHVAGEYIAGRAYKVMLCDECRGVAELVVVQKTSLGEMTAAMSLLDTGMMLPETADILKSIYPDISRDSELDYCIFKYKSYSPLLRSAAKVVLQEIKWEDDYLLAECLGITPIEASHINAELKETGFLIECKEESCYYMACRSVEEVDDFFESLKI